DAVTTVATTVATGALVWFVYSAGSASRTTTAGAATGPAVELVSGLETSVTDTTLRKGVAKLAVIEFSDFQCPFCGRSARDTYPQLQREFINAGSVEYVFRNFPLEAI